MLQKTTDDWIQVFDAAGVPAAPVRLITELPDDPQVLANDLRVEMDHPVAGRMTMVGPLVQMSETPVRARSAPPTLGQHNDEILSELGYRPDEVQRLRTDGIIR
jgi:crotonobetainyl-CoA:carnitine CoA-transferase CaiB-like acyl-CoA transferase